MRYSLPKRLTWFTLGACILPSLINFTTYGLGLEGSELKSSELLLHARIMHIALDSVAVTIAFLTAILGFIHFSTKRDIVAPIVGVALFCAALPDILHILGSASFIPAHGSQHKSIVTYTWTFSRGFHVLVLMVGTSLFLLRSIRQKDYGVNRQRRFVITMSILFLALTGASIMMLFFTRDIPQMIFAGRLIPRPYDFAILVVYVLAGVFVLPTFSSRFPSLFSQTLVLSLVPAIATQMHMAFGSEVLYDDDFFAAHFLKCITYFVPFVGLALTYYHSQKNEVVTLARLQEEVRERTITAETLKGVLNSSLSGIQVFRAIRNGGGKIVDFECLLMNPAAEQIEGKKAGDVVGRRLLEVYPFTKEGRFFDRYVQLVESGSPLNYEYFSAQHKKWLHSMAVKVEDGFAVTFTDITQRKHTEEALIQGKRKFETVFNQTFQFIHVLTPEGIVVDVNGTSLKFSGTEAWQVVGKHFWEIPEWSIELNKGGSISEVVLQAAEGAFVRKEASISDKEGKRIAMDFSVKPVKSDQGEIILLLAEGRDITQQKEAAEQIRKYQEELELRIEELNRSNQELEQFAYVASHDLQEPLRKVRAFGDRLVNKYKEQLGEEGKGYIERMENAATRMQVLIDDLLNFSRLSRTKEPFVPVDLKEICRSVINDLEISIEQKKANIILENLPVIEAIPSQMRQLFQNLISNAIKFSSKDRDPEIIIRGETFADEHGKQMSRVQVKDNGIGFDEKYADRIFNIFQRLHGRNEYAGTGIGLAVCKKITENHGGGIRAEGNPGEGSAFIIELPLKHTTAGGI